MFICSAMLWALAIQLQHTIANAERLPLMRYNAHGVLLRPPLAFAYTQKDDKNTANSFPHDLLDANSSPVESKLYDKQDEVKRKDTPENNIEQKKSRKDFVIYVPETDGQDYEGLVPLSKEESKHKPTAILKESNFEKGTESDLEESHHKESHDEGRKAYKGHHKEHKVENSSHSKEGKSGEFDEEGGDKKEHHKEHDYEAGYKNEESGSKDSTFEDSGDYDKGHSTKGTHNVNKKEHFVKKIEFFDEYHEDSDQDEEGSKEDDKEYQRGHHGRKSKKNGDYEYASDTNANKYTHGNHHHINKGKNHAQGYANNHGHNVKKAKKCHDGDEVLWKVIITEKGGK